MAFVCGDTPLWNNYSVAYVFADPFLDPVQRRSEATVPPFHRLAGSVQLLGEVLAQVLGSWLQPAPAPLLCMP